MLEAAQIRAARALLNWSQSELARKADVGFATVQRAEQREGTVKGMVDTVIKLRKALEGGGVEFIEPEGRKGPGVRFAQVRDDVIPI